MTKELQEQLKTVAEYEEWKPFTSSYGGYGLCKDEKDMSTCIQVGDLQYHSSWNAQIPVTQSCFEHRKINS